MKLVPKPFSWRASTAEPGELRETDRASLSTVTCSVLLQRQHGKLMEEVSRGTVEIHAAKTFNHNNSDDVSISEIAKCMLKARSVGTGFLQETRWEEIYNCKEGREVQMNKQLK